VNFYIIQYIIHSGRCRNKGESW